MAFGKYIPTVALVGAALLASNGVAATIVSQEQGGTEVSVPGITWGESFATPVGVSFHDVTITFYAAKGGAVAAGAGYLFAAPYAGGPSGLGAASALATSVSSTGGVWSFAPTFTLAPGTRYYFYEDTPLPALLGDAVSAAGDAYFVTFNSNTNFIDLGPNDIDYTVTGVSAIPEPAPWGMMLAGLSLGGLVLRRRRTAPI
jgi:methyl coenzyme M reductase beta subunit